LTEHTDYVEVRE